MNSYWILWYLSGLGPSVAVEQVMLYEEFEDESEKPIIPINNDDPLILNTPDPRQTGRSAKHRSKSGQRSQVAPVDQQSYDVIRTSKHQQRGRGKWQ